MFVEYAKAGPEDLLIRVTVHNRGPEAATLHVLPHALVPQHLGVGAATPSRRVLSSTAAHGAARRRSARDLRVELPRLYCDGEAPTLLFTENETNAERLFGVAERRRPYVKDGFNDYVVDGDTDAVNPDRHRHQGRGRTTCSTCPAGGVATVRLRLRRRAGDGADRRPSTPTSTRCSPAGAEADEFYAR